MGTLRRVWAVVDAIAAYAPGGLLILAGISMLIGVKTGVLW